MAIESVTKYGASPPSFNRSVQQTGLAGYFVLFLSAQNQVIIYFTLKDFDSYNTIYSYTVISMFRTNSFINTWILIKLTDEKGFLKNPVTMTAFSTQMPDG